jgi:hypothetical protein
MAKFYLARKEGWATAALLASTTVEQEAFLPALSSASQLTCCTGVQGLSHLAKTVTFIQAKPK